MKVRRIFFNGGEGGELTRGGLTVILALFLQRWRQIFIRLNINKYKIAKLLHKRCNKQPINVQF